MSALRILALSTLASASGFVVAAALISHPQQARQITAAASGVAEMFDEDVWQPSVTLAKNQDAALLDTVDRPAAVRLTMTPPGPGDVRTYPHAHVTPPAPRTVTADDDRLTDPQFAASATVTILPDLSPESAPVPPEPKLVRPQAPAAPQFDIARSEPAFRIPEPPPLSQPLSQPPSTRGDVAALRLKASLTPQMLRNFDLFIYVSKADHGALGQRMLVFRKSDSGALQLAYDWAASTGREKDEITPRGRTTFTATPTGFYEFDPDRMYRRYHSYSWDQDMPNAMFFNWEREGLETGLAIHAAVGDDIAKLGGRASAGCVHLSPENAATLYHLIRDDYAGPVPRFAYNGDTQTMSNRGDFAHRRDGSLKMADGYRVLVQIEDYAGGNVIASLN